MSSSDCTTTSVLGGVAASVAVDRAASINSGRTLAFIDISPECTAGSGAEKSLLSLVFAAFRRQHAR
ncbi:hypothetical protein D3C81_1551890 [compost metagenome]